MNDPDEKGLVKKKKHKFWYMQRKDDVWFGIPLSIS